jgi:hypothetical protein
VGPKPSGTCSLGQDWPGLHQAAPSRYSHKSLLSLDKSARMVLRARHLLAVRGTRKGAPTNRFGTPTGPVFSGFARLCQAPDKMVLCYLLASGGFPPGAPADEHRSLHEWARALTVAVRDRIGGHIGERLDRERRIVARRGREVRAADDEQIGDVPALRVFVDH